MDDGEAHVAYVNLREQILRFREERREDGEIMQQGLEMEGQGMMEREIMERVGGIIEREGGMMESEGGMMEREEEGMRRHGEVPKDITACDPTADITVYVVNNITQAKESFNVTIIEGEPLAHALLRAWRDPDIDFK